MSPSKGQDEDALLAIVRDCDWLMDALRAARQLQLRDWCIAAGAIRNTVWDHLHDRVPTVPGDIDLVHFDPADMSRARDTALEEDLARAAPGLPWQVTNQAGVHEWYAARFGHRRPPLHSLAEGLMSWPETATAVGVWLDAQDRLRILAPLGLGDLLGLRLRHNAAGVDAAAFQRRLEEKQFLRRWPKLEPQTPHLSTP